MKVNRDGTEENFGQRIEQWVEAGIAAGPKDFNQLLRHLPSVYPTAVVDALLSLLAKRRIDANTLARLSPRNATESPANWTAYSVLPPPHPLNFEWRFTTQSAQFLLDLAIDICRPRERVLLFGTPGLALHAIARVLGRSTTFLGEDNLVTHRLIGLNREVGHPILIEYCGMDAGQHHGADAVVLDPPWYLDHICQMLGSAAASCNVNGHILISLPPDGVRPNVVEDRARVMAFAEKLGLRAVSGHALALNYETPYFEKNALAACSLQIGGHWRRGDLVVFRKVIVSSSQTRSSNAKMGHWREIEIGRMRLLVRLDTATRKGQVLQPLVEGDILPTVSRRNHIRDRIQVWTSGNRVFASSAPDLVILAALIASDGPIGSSSLPCHCGNVRESREVERLARELRTAAALEAREEGLAHAPVMEKRDGAQAPTSESYRSKLAGFVSK